MEFVVQDRTSHANQVISFARIRPAEDLLALQADELNVLAHSQSHSWVDYVNKRDFMGSWDVLPLRCLRQHVNAHAFKSSQEQAMSKYLLAYYYLIGSAEKLDYCRQANSLNDLLTRIKLLWNCNQLSDCELLGEISLLNQIPISTSSVELVSNCLPYRYQPKAQ